MKQSIYILSLVLAMFLSACAATQTSRSTGQTIDDTTITASVKTEIAKAEGIGDAARINVDTYRGVVSLAGFVDSEQQKRDAAQAAMRASGVEKLINNLIVKPPPQ